MSIVIKDADGTIRYPFGKVETPEEKIARLEKELQERDERMKMHEELIAELAMMMLD